MSGEEPDPGRSWRLGLLVAFAAFCALLGLLLRNAQLVALGEAIGVALGLSFLLGRAAAARIEVRRLAPPQACEDEWIAVELRVRNAGRWPCGRIELRDRFAADGLFERADLIWSLGPGEERGVVFERPCARGRGVFRCGPLTLAVCDPLGVFRFERELREIGAEEVVVWPLALPSDALELTQVFAPALAGAGERPRPGAGIQPLALREHRPGLPLQRIHWRASARLGRLVLTEREAPALAQLVIALDCSRGGIRGVGRRSNVELTIRLAASLLEEAVARGHACGLLADDGRPWALPPRSGLAARAAFLDALARLSPQGAHGIDELLSRGLAHAAPGVCLVVVLPRWRIEGGPLVDALALWLARGARVSAFVVDDRTLMAHEWAAPVGSHEAVELLAELGIPASVVDASVEATLAPRGEVAAARGLGEVA